LWFKSYRKGGKGTENTSSQILTVPEHESRFLARALVCCDCLTRRLPILPILPIRYKNSDVEGFSKKSSGSLTFSSGCADKKGKPLYAVAEQPTFMEDV